MLFEALALAGNLWRGGCICWGAWRGGSPEAGGTAGTRDPLLGPGMAVYAAGLLI
jgi:hypothetical protein